MTTTEKNQPEYEWAPDVVGGHSPFCEHPGGHNPRVSWCSTEHPEVQYSEAWKKDHPTRENFWASVLTDERLARDLEALASDVRRYGKDQRAALLQEAARRIRKQA